MNAHITETEQVSPSDVLEMATWNRQRSTDELLSFISSRHASLGDVELGL
jgi:hypothetical protein